MQYCSSQTLFRISHKFTQKLFRLKSELWRPYAVVAVGIEFAAISLQFRVRVVERLMGIIPEGLDLMRKTENSSQDFQQKRSFLSALILLASFTERFQDTGFSIFVSATQTEREKVIIASFKRQKFKLCLPF